MVIFNSSNICDGANKTSRDVGSHSKKLLGVFLFEIASANGWLEKQRFFLANVIEDILTN